MPAPAKPADTLNGVLAATLAYVIWGLVVVYWKWVGAVSAWEVLAHRVVWCLVFLVPIVLALGRWAAIRRALTTRRTLLALAACAVFIGSNWGIFIWAVQQGRIIETSLGYYINPLIVIAIGVVLLGEKLSPVRIASLVLAAVGVAMQAWALGFVPWISLVLATSFAIYGYIRKVVSVEALDGLFIETLLIAPIALGYLLWREGEGDLAFAHTGPSMSLLLMLAGPITAVPLWMFAVGARGVRMSTMGFLQYIAPTISLVIAVALYDEPFDMMRLVSFGFIWAALVVVSLEAFRRPMIVSPEER
ncbi:MAG: EamA family transporter RarD [Alphaproteobacteria bacterium]|nr:EamA family transporter RarD [Alphaproteobacteria bacterium]